MPVATNRKARKVKGNFKAEILPNAFYSPREISDRNSPYYIASPASISRWIADGSLRVSRQGRRVFIRGSAILEMLSGERAVA